MKLKLGI